VSARDFFRRHVFHNLALKITSLALASALWLAVSSSPPSEVALNVPIIFRNVPANLEISSENIPTVQIRVRGPERIVRRLEPADVRAEVDVTGIRPGERSFDLTKAITVPDKLEVAQVVPSEVHVNFDIRAVREVPVKPRVVPSYQVGSIFTDPATVEIIGPKKQVDAVDSAITDPIDVTGVLDQITVTRIAYVSDPLIQVTNPNPVRITITMEKEKEQKAVPQLKSQ
jgi:YbbR domain-containing protein